MLPLKSYTHVISAPKDFSPIKNSQKLGLMLLWAYLSVYHHSEGQHRLTSLKGQTEPSLACPRMGKMEGASGPLKVYRTRVPVLEGSDPPSRSPAC